MQGELEQAQFQQAYPQQAYPRGNRSSHWKQNARFRKCYTVPALGVKCETKMGVGTLVISQDRPMFSHINGKHSPQPFKWYGWTQADLEK